MKNKILKPLMFDNEIKIIEKQLLDLGISGNINILEWGSGGSTVYFTNFLRQNKIKYNWLSIEYNKEWYEKVLSFVQNDKNTQMKLFDVGDNQLKQRFVDMDEYVNYPKTLDKKFDFILVDGRKRRRCLFEAKDLLNSYGVVYLHDAHRRYYHCGFKNYSDSLFVGIYLWRGKKEVVGLYKKVINMIVSKFYIFAGITKRVLSHRRVYSNSPFLQKIKKKIFLKFHLNKNK